MSDILHQLEDIQDMANLLIKDNTRLRKALKFYALEDNWSYSVGEAIFHPADEYGSGPRWAKEALQDGDNDG